MDNEQAKFILQSFRPDGADAQDPDFAEALALAAQDRELGDWLASERAQDAAFAAALNDVEIPEDLRESILTVLRGDAEVEDYSEMDATFAGALASVRPPAGLRDQIVTAMNVERSKGESEAKSAPRRVHNWLRSAAIAAALVLGAFVAIQVTGSEPTLAKKEIEGKAISLVHHGATLDVKGPQASDLITYLEAKNLPVPNLTELPPGLAGVKAIGCQVVKIGEKNASLICFDKNGLGEVHLIVVRREDLIDKKLLALSDVKSKDCYQCSSTGVSVAVWGDDKRAFFLASDTDPDDLLKTVF